jgi:hypothetical protein
MRNASVATGIIGVIATIGAVMNRKKLRGSASMTDGIEKDRRLAMLALAKAKAKGVVVPAPTTWLDSGQQANVFDTTDHNVVVRVGDKFSINSELSLLDEDFADGVVRVIAIVVEEDHVVTWKERLDPNVEALIIRNYGWNTEGYLKLAGALSGLYDSSESKLRILRMHPETNGLARAIRNGLPTGDLDLTSNLGVTSDGRIVAYDL